VLELLCEVEVDDELDPDELGVTLDTVAPARGTVVPVTSGESTRQDKYLCVQSTRVSYHLRLEPLRGSSCYRSVRVLLMRFLGQASEGQRQGTHRCVDVGPLGYSRAIWDRLGEAGVGG
jgi:hypothetical protein